MRERLRHLGFLHALARRKKGRIWPLSSRHGRLKWHTVTKELSFARIGGDIVPTSFANKTAPPTPVVSVLSIAKRSMIMSINHKMRNNAFNRKWNRAGGPG